MFDSSTHLPPSLLCVEDDPLARASVLRALKHRFPLVETHAAANGEQGLELFHKHRPDVVITDIRMPERDGISMAREILAIDPATAIVVFSAHTDVTYMLDSMKMGVRHYLVKPLDMEQLMVAVKECFLEVMKRRRQNEMERAQRMESLGIVAGGIAHDFNNILTGILGSISIAQEMTGVAGPVRGVLDQAEKASLRAAELARRLLTFARGGKPLRRQVSVRSLVDEAVSFSLSGSNLTARVKIPQDIHALEADPLQIHQAFNNILINAVHAMVEGEIAVSAENVTLEEGNPLRLAPGGYVRIAFKDHGCGIPKAEQERIFDPYFSTKPGASGLGLATTHSIVTRHGGHMSVQSTPGKGATFVCHLPSTGAPFPAGEPAPPPPPPHEAKGGAVLLMDDEHVVRKVTGKMLECLGYRVTTCRTGEEAIRLYRERMESYSTFRAVIVDLTIAGGMGGKEAARHILALDPGAKLVVSSGYFDDPVLADHEEHGFAAVLPKPYKSSDLAQVLGSLGP